MVKVLKAVFGAILYCFLSMYLLYTFTPLNPYAIVGTMMGGWVVVCAVFLLYKKRYGTKIEE